MMQMNLFEIRDRLLDFKGKLRVAKGEGAGEG